MYACPVTPPSSSRCLRSRPNVRASAAVVDAATSGRGAGAALKSGHPGCRL